MQKSLRGGGKTLSYLLAGMVALATSSAWAASFWKGTGPESGEAANWDNGKAFMGNDYFYFRDEKMTGADYRRYMQLTADANNTNGQGMLFQCGTENDPFVIEDDGENHTITLKYYSSSNVGGIYIGHSKNANNTCNYGGVELRGGIWTCDQIYVGDSPNYCGYLRLNGASLTTTGSSSNPCENGKIVVDAGMLTFAKGLSLGKDGGTAELVVNGGTMSCGGDLLLGSASGDNGSLTVNGGTLTVSSGWTKGYSNKATVNLNGGTLCTYHIHQQEGSTTVNFNGGTLKATKAYTSNGGLIHGKVSVTVGANGGVIDNGGFNVSIAAAIDGTGGLTFTGGSTITLAGAVNYNGATAVTPGTVLAVANETAKNNILENGLVIAGIPSEGQVVMTFTSDLSGADLSNVTCPLAPDAKFAIGGEGNKSIVVDSVGTELANYWTGAVDNNLSNADNWKGGLPTDNANIFCETPAALTKGDGFAPAAITFLAGSAAVTIDGDEFTGVVAVTNLSSVSHTINAKVYFEGDIQVKQAAMADVGDLDKAHVTFAGGAYAADGCALENGNSDAVYSRCMFGKYYFASTEKDPWTATIYGSKKRICVAPDSYLHIPYAGNLKELDICDRAKVEVGVFSLGVEGRLSHNNLGEMVVENIVMTGSSNRYMTYDQSSGNESVFKFESVTNSMSGNWFYFADGSSASKHTFYIGKGGLNYSGDKATYVIGDNKESGCEEIIRPWYDDFTIANRSDGGKALVFMYNVEFCTDDENGDGRTITIDAVTRGYRGSSPAITVSGKGSLKVNKAAQNDNNGVPSVTVKDTATLAFGANGSLGTGAITLGNGTKLVLTADSKDYTLVNKLSLPSGDNKVAMIRIDGKRLRSGDDQEIATVASGTGVALDPNSTALAGRDGWLEVKDGKLCLTIKSGGTMIVIR